LAAVLILLSIFTLLCVLLISCGGNVRQLALSWCWDVSEAGLCSIVDSCR